MAIKPIEVLIRVKDEASSMLGSVQAKVAGLAVAVAGFFGVTLFAGAVKSSAEFEAALSRVKAATDATASEMALLKQAAEDAGANTKYTSVQAGYDCVAMREIVSFVLSELVWLTLTAQLTLRSYVQIGDCSLTLDEANTRIADLRALPLF